MEERICKTWQNGAIETTGTVSRRVKWEIVLKVCSSNGRLLQGPTCFDQFWSMLSQLSATKAWNELALPSRKSGECWMPPIALIADPGITKTGCCQFGLLSAQLQKNISSGLVISFTFQHCEGRKRVLRQGCKGREDTGSASPSSCLWGWSGTGAGLSEERGVLSL